MKKLLSVFLSVLMVAELAACGNTKQDVTAEEGFVPALDTQTCCHFNFDGGYDNF